ncbi:MAG: 5-(carboxyamino)imidazole ribonucleotide mutase [Thermoplasmata archaeon HGW-Thermoplasmata-1]|nr:MAG: 5-(carboxyamino)imidazole ribonucleotide mutase [Thermoplasmata archaeon HGW-Thermoplasmata-1]
MVVQIIMGSKSDLPVGEKARDILKKLGVPCEMAVASAHRTPDIVEQLAKRGDVDVFIAIAGLAAALPGCVAAVTTKPVIGVPVSGKVNLDAILSIVQMSPGIPVAAVGLDRGENAGILAAEMVALKDDKVAAALKAYRQEMRTRVMEDSKEVSAL